MILVTNAITREGVTYKVSKMMRQESPFFDSRDSILTGDIEEINFSDLHKYEGLPYIKTDVNDAGKKGERFLSFEIEENAIIYVAYEKLDSIKNSTVPAWLTEFKKEDGQIVAQYRYFDVYSKNFPKGKVILPAADTKANNVGSNYFIIVKKPGKYLYIKKYRLNLIPPERSGWISQREGSNP